jgi:predicted ester cyclase
MLAVVPSFNRSFPKIPTLVIQSYIMKVQTFAIIAVSCTFLVVSARGQTAEENKKVITHYLLEIFNGRKLELLGEVFPEKFVRHDLNDGTDTWMTIADQQKRLKDLFQAFPDFYYTIGDIIAEGDKVVVRAVWHGTQKSTFMKTESLGKRVDSVSEVIFYKLENGKIVERWTQLDLLSLFKKMKGEK